MSTQENHIFGSPDGTLGQSPPQCEMQCLDRPPCLCIISAKSVQQFGAQHLRQTDTQTWTTNL